MRPASLTILADDLTGACDAAAQFARTGTMPLVLLECGARSADAGIVAYDLDLRDRPAEETYGRVRQAVAHCGPAGDSLFAKVDSTLRGSVVEFLSGILDAAAAPVGVIAPAYPQQGRSLVQARLRVSGDEADPVDLLDALARRGHAALHVPIAPRITRAAVARAIGEAHARSIRFVVVDGATDDDLGAVAAAALESSWPVLLAGSGGLARALADVTAPRGADEKTMLKGAGPVLVFAGSPALATRRQINRLTGQSRVRVVALPCAQVGIDGEAVVVFAAASGDETKRIVRDECRTSALLAQCAVALAAECRPRAVVLIGGASARAICRGVGAHGLALRGEAVPGMPWGRLCGGEWDGVPVLTKSGGFGPPTLLADAIEWCQAKVECT